MVFKTLKRRADSIMSQGYQPTEEKSYKKPPRSVSADGLDVPKFKREKKERVNHPAHYNRPGAMECWDEMELVFGIKEVMTFCKLNAWKYRCRAIDKNGEEDLKKSDVYLKKYKELKERVDEYNANNYKAKER